MLATLALFFKGVAILLMVLLVIGLFKPWWALWWADTQNRLKVILLYGSLAAGFYFLGWIIG